ncbi:MAG: SPOR domain-containing protein [Rhodobacterales bacterium]|nr:MAG: SPOR domain-containing protein [Rhodobacterales bacterium]
MKFKGILKVGTVLSLTLVLAGCDENGEFTLLQKPEARGDAAPTGSTKTIERDVEAPEVFQVTEAGLWDGRPSLGGVWVAHPDVKQPERVILRNSANDKFVVGALFRRERENPGPRLQVSSDAAAALGMLAGQPAKINVTALRKEEVAETSDPAAEGNLKAPETVEATSLDPIAGAAAAIDAAETKPAETAVPVPAPKPKASGLSKPFIQIGIFSVEQNARNTATAMRQDGMVPTVKKQSLKGKTFWRVLVGPANTSLERSALLKKIKASGFTDAYAVTN